MRKRAIVLCVLACLFLAACGKKTVTDEQALSAVKQYCYSSNPELERIESTGEYPVYWQQLFAMIGQDIPQDIPGTNPQAMAQDPHLRPVHLSSLNIGCSK